jgi:hypothetical protein
MLSLKDKYIGLWILAVWSAAHIVPAAFVATDTVGPKSTLLWLLIGAEVALTAGLFLRWRAARYQLAAQICFHVLLLSLVGWAFVFVAFAWGLHGSEIPILCGIGVYLSFVCWGFMYLFHPDVADHFART